MRNILVIALVVALSACTTSKPTIAQSDSIRVEIRDRVVYLHDTLYYQLQAESHSNVTRDSASFLETMYATSTASIDSNGFLRHNLINKNIIIPIHTTDTIHVHDTITQESKATTKIVEVEKELTALQRISILGFWLLVFALIIIRK